MTVCCEKEVLILTRLARYLLRRVAECENKGGNARVYHHAFHLTVKVLHGVLTGRINAESLVPLMMLLDRSAFFDIIKAGNPRMDGGAGSGNHGHKGRPGQQGGSSRSLSPEEKAKITNRLVGKSTHDGIMITSVSRHAFDRIGDRKMSVGRIDRMRNTGITSPGNLPHTRCYDIAGSRMVIDTDKGKVITVMWRKGGKNK